MELIISKNYTAINKLVANIKDTLLSIYVNLYKDSLEIYMLNFIKLIE